MEPKLHPIQNTGFIEQPPFLTDWMAGGESGITEIEFQPTGQWDTDLPTGERQKNTSFESNLCVTFSGLNVIETIVNHQIKYKLLSEETIQAIKDLGFLDEKGIFNCNEMFSANMNGSTPNGNALGNFWLSVRRDGLLPQKDWFDVYNDIHSFTQLYQPVSQTLKDKAKKILDILEINYHWVLTGVPNSNVLKTYLKQSPLHVATPVCPTWNSGYVNYCGKTACEHATMLYGFSGTNFKDFDHYVPFDKQLVDNYYIPYAIGCSITEKKSIQPLKPFWTFFRQFGFGTKGDDILALQKILIYEGLLNADLATGYFGENTKKGLIGFQQKYARDILAPLGLAIPTGYVGTRTIVKLNELYGTKEKVVNIQSGWLSTAMDFVLSFFER